MDCSSLLLPPSVRPHRADFSGPALALVDRGSFRRYRVRMLNGRWGSSDDHPLLVTARDVPARARLRSRMGQERKDSCAPVLQEFGGKGAGQTRGGKVQGQDMPRGCRPVACDPGDLGSALACVEAIRYGTKRLSIIYGSTGYDAYVLFWKLMTACAPRLVSGPEGPRAAPTRPIPTAISYSRIGSAPCRILRTLCRPSLCIELQGAASKQESLVSGMA